LGGGRVFVDQVVQNGFPADPFSIDVGHRGAASVTFVVRDTDSGAQDRGAVALEDDVVRTGEVDPRSRTRNLMSSNGWSAGA
jgi:hypothetical protein